MIQRMVQKYKKRLDRAITDLSKGKRVTPKELSLLKETLEDMEKIKAYMERAAMSQIEK